MKQLIFLFTALLFFYSCDPPRNCTDPRCLSSDVFGKIPAHLSGNLDSVIHLGDSLVLYMKIPDTLETNYGPLVFGNMYPNSFFGYFCAGGDSLVGSGEGYLVNSSEAARKIIIYGGDTTRGKYWHFKSREYKCVFTPKRKGKYILELMGGRLEMRAKGNREWLVNPQITLDNEKRYNQYLSWMAPSMREEALSIVQKKKGWYCFEVK